jgi:hypothetical protein
MEENWYAVEQQVRDRLNEARAAARTRALGQNLAPTARRPNSVGFTIIRLANWILARAMQLPPELSRALAKMRGTRERRESAAAREGTPHVPRGHPNSDQGVDAKGTLDRLSALLRP